MVGSLFIMEGFTIEAGCYRKASNHNAVLKITMPF